MNPPATLPPPPALPLSLWLPLLSALPLRTLSLDLTLRRPVHLRNPASAVVRGLLGERFRDLRCLTRAPTCEACTEKPRCDYARVYGTDDPTHPGPAGAFEHPYWLQGIPADHDIFPGTRLTARLTLAGFATDLAPYLDCAFRDALAHLGPDDARAAGPLHELSASRLLPIPILPAGPEARTWRIEARTPLLLTPPKTGLPPCPAAPWLARLVVAGTRRLRALLRMAAPDVVLPPVALPDLTDVELVEGGFSSWRGSLFSRRQGQRFRLDDGFAGNAVVRGDAVASVAALLRALAVASVGKKTTMGFGWIQVTPLS